MYSLWSFNFMAGSVGLDRNKGSLAQSSHFSLDKPAESPWSPALRSCGRGLLQGGAAPGPGASALCGRTFPWPLVPKSPSAPWWCLRHHQVLKENIGLLTETSCDERASKPPDPTHSKEELSLLCGAFCGAGGAEGFIAVGIPGGTKRCSSRIAPESPKGRPLRLLHSPGHEGAPWKERLSLVLVWSAEDPACSTDSPSFPLSIPSPCPSSICLPPQHNLSQGNCLHSFPQTFSPIRSPSWLSRSQRKTSPSIGSQSQAPCQPGAGLTRVQG